MNFTSFRLILLDHTTYVLVLKSVILTSVGRPRGLQYDTVSSYDQGRATISKKIQESLTKSLANSVARIQVDSRERKQKTHVIEWGRGG